MADSPNVTLVKRNLDAWQDMDSYIKKLDEFLDPDIEWLNTGLPENRGIEQARTTLRRFATTFGSLKVEYLNIAEQGNKVWTERIDYIVDKDGKTVIVAPDMGIFEIEKGKIKRWRDYFDASPFLALAQYGGAKK